MGEGIAEFKKLIASGDKDARMRLQVEIRERVKKITLWNKGVKDPSKLPARVSKEPMPTAKVELADGTVLYVQTMKTAFPRGSRK